MNGFFRFLICFAVSFVAVYLSGYGNTVGDISESLAITTFFGAVLVLSTVCTIIWSVYSYLTREIKKLNTKIDELEEKLNKYDK